MKKLPRIISVFLLILVLVQPIIFAVSADNGSTIVYVTNTGYAYHRSNCSYLKSKNSITLMEATRRGYKPCSRCDPPIFNGILPTETEPPKETSNSGTGGSGTTSWEEYKKKRGLSAEAASNGTDKGTNGSTGSGKTNSAEATAPSLTTRPTTVVPNTEKNEKNGNSAWPVILAFSLPFPIILICALVSDAVKTRRRKKQEYIEKRKKFVAELSKLTAQATLILENKDALSRVLMKDINSSVQDFFNHMMDSGLALTKVGETAKVTVKDPQRLYRNCVTTNKSSCFHTTSCKCIARSRDKLVKVGHLNASRFLKLKPCSVCQPNREIEYVNQRFDALMIKGEASREYVKEIEEAITPETVNKLSELQRRVHLFPEQYLSKRQLKKELTKKQKKKLKRYQKPTIRKMGLDETISFNGGGMRAYHRSGKPLIVMVIALAASIIFWMIISPFVNQRLPQTSSSRPKSYSYYGSTIPTFDLDSLPKPTYPVLTELPPFSEQEDGYIVCYKDMTIHKDINCSKIPDDAYCLEVDDISTYGSFDNCDTCNP